MNPGKSDALANRRLYDGDEPAPTVAFGHDAGGWQWVQRERSGERSEEGFDQHEMPSQALTSKTRSWTLHTNRDQRDDGSRQTRPAPAPAPALTGKAGGQWYVERPAVTVAGDPSLGSPGHRDRDGGEHQYENAVRVTAEEATILQGFRPDYPFQGSRTAQFRQIGDAVPPPLAHAVIAALLGDS